MDSANPALSAISAAVTKIDHVGLAVRDLDAAVDFYERAFGFRKAHEEVNEEQGVREAMIAIGDSGQYLQLLAPLNENSTIAKFLSKNGEGMQQLAYTVDDLAATSQRLRDAGVRLLYPEAKRGTAGSKINFCHPKDCGGVLVELVEHVAGEH
ncbi:MAG: methylmalonyl-CoA epimerase [Candidatus Nanopelagicales bacterium]